MYALIQKSDNKIIKISSEFAELSKVKPFYWIDCPQDCTEIWTYDGKNFIKPLINPETNEQASARVRAERDSLLSFSDWTQVADSPVNKQAWATYRQALRDLPDQDGFPFEVVYPTKP